MIEWICLHELCSIIVWPLVKRRIVEIVLTSLLAFRICVCMGVLYSCPGLLPIRIVHPKCYQYWPKQIAIDISLIRVRYYLTMAECSFVSAFRVLLEFWWPTRLFDIIMYCLLNVYTSLCGSRSQCLSHHASTTALTFALCLTLGFIRHRVFLRIHPMPWPQGSESVSCGIN